jgi:hypothetical protein
MMQVDHPCAEMYSGGWSAGFSSQGREGPSGGGTVARRPAGVASTLKTAGAFLFLLPGGHPRRRDEEGAASATGAFLFPLPFGRPGFRFSGMAASPGAPVAWGVTEGEAAAAVLAARASKVLLLRLPFGRPRPRGAEGAVSGASTSSLTPSGILSPLSGEWPGDDMTGPGSRREREGEVADALSNEHARYLKESGERVTPDVSVTNFHVMRHYDGCRSGSWEGSIGRVADVRRPTPHGDSRSYDKGNSEVKVTRLVTGTLSRPLRGNKIRSGASSQEASRRLGVRRFRGPQPGHHQSRFVPRRPEELRETRLSRRSWDFDKDEQDFGEKKNPPKPHASPWDFASFGG